MKSKKINWNYLLIAPALLISVSVILLPGIMTIGMLAAMLLLSRSKTRSIYQVAFLIPYVLAPAVNAMLWLNVIFSPVVGVVSFLKSFGIDLGSPLASMKSAIFACAGVDIWHYWSYLTVIYLAALRHWFLPCI